MTKYRLKDAELQKKLDEITDGDFSKQLAWSKATPINGHGQFFIDAGEFGGWKHGRIRFFLSKKEIEKFEEYNPDDWNNFPAVTPPENVKMRVEVIFSNPQPGELMAYSGCAIFNGSYFVDSNTQKGIRVNDLNDVRFRPWE